MQLSKIIEWSFNLLPFIPIYIYGKSVFRNMEMEIKIYWLFLMFAFVYQMGLLLAATNHIHNSFFIVLFQLIEYTVLSVLFFMWNSNMIIRILIPVFLIVNLFSFTYFFLGNSINYSVTIDKYLRNFVLIPLSFFTAYKFAISSKRELMTDGKFWILAGILVNTSLSAFILVFRSYSSSNAEMALFAEKLLLAINLVTYIIFIKGFLCFKTKTKYSGSSL